MNIYKVYEKVFKVWRAKRYAIFLEKIQPEKQNTMLDIGGTYTTWQRNGQPVDKIVAINQSKPKESFILPPGLNIEFLAGDACELPFSDQSFDLVFSNSVIEHVGDLERQKLFAEEARRVGGKLWVQTPAQECPLEPHYLAPFVHWLPVSVRRKVLRWFTPWGWMQKPNQEKVDSTIKFTQLLTKKQFASMFPDCEIYTEKLLFFFPKSYTAIRLKE